MVNSYNDVVSLEDGLYYVQGVYSSETEYIHVSRDVNDLFDFEERKLNEMLED